MIYLICPTCATFRTTFRLLRAKVLGLGVGYELAVVNESRVGLTEGSGHRTQEKLEKFSHHEGNTKQTQLSNQKATQKSNARHDDPSKSQHKTNTKLPKQQPTTSRTKQKQDNSFLFLFFNNPTEITQLPKLTC